MKKTIENRMILTQTGILAIFFMALLIMSGCSVRGSSDGSGRKLCFVFYDGYETMETIVLDSFNSRNLDAGVAVCANLVNGTWESQALMDWDQIQHLANHGWDVYSHGYNHAAFNATGLSSTQITNEIVTSKEWIEGNLTGGYEDFWTLWFGGGYDNVSYTEPVAANYFASSWSSSGDTYAGGTPWFYPANVSLQFTGQALGSYINFRDVASCANEFNVTAIVVGEALIDNFVANASDNTCLVLGFHQVLPSFSGWRDYPYCDTTLGNLTAILDYAQDYEDAGNFTITTLSSAMSARYSAVQIDLLVPSMMSLAIIVGVVVIIKRKI